MKSYDSICCYKIFLKSDPSMLYIGSTIHFSRRKSQHKKNTTNKKSKHYWQPLYQFIRAMGGWENFEIIQIGQFPCLNTEDRHGIERELILQHNAKINVLLTKK